MPDDPRIQRLAQVIHDNYVHLHPDAPQAIRDQRGKPSRAAISAAYAIYESPQVRADLAETTMPATPTENP